MGDCTQLCLGYCCIISEDIFPPEISFPLVSKCSLEWGLLFFVRDSSSYTERQELCSICSYCLEFRVENRIGVARLYVFVFNDVWNLSTL